MKSPRYVNELRDPHCAAIVRASSAPSCAGEYLPTSQGYLPVKPTCEPSEGMQPIGFWLYFVRLPYGSVGDLRPSWLPFTSAQNINSLRGRCPPEKSTAAGLDSSWPDRCPSTYLFGVGNSRRRYGLEPGVGGFRKAQLDGAHARSGWGRPLAA